MEICIEGQKLLDEPASIEKLLQVIGDEMLRKQTEQEIQKYQTGHERWDAIKKLLSNVSFDLNF